MNELFLFWRLVIRIGVVVQILHVQLKSKMLSFDEIRNDWAVVTTGL